MTLRARRRFALLLVLAISLTACTGGELAEDPKDQLIAALRGVAAGEGVTITLSLDTDEAALQALAAADGDMPPEAATLLTTTSLRVSVPLDETAAETAAFAVRIGDTDVVELRYADEVLYLRADVPALLTAAGQDPAMVEGVEAMLAETGVVPADALRGRWLALRGAEQTLEALTGTPMDPAPEDEARAEEAAARLATVLADASSVEHVGDDAAGRHLRATIPLRDAYEALLAEAEALGMGTPLADGMTAPADVPDESVTVDLWVAGGRLTVVSLDLLEVARMDPEAPEIPDEVERLALRLDLEPFDGVIAAPADAVELDTEALMGMFMGAMMGGMAGGMGEMPADATAVPFPAEPPANAQATGPNPVLAGFYEQPGYGEARSRYCDEVSDMPAPVRSRHYGDICPAV